MTLEAEQQIAARFNVQKVLWFILGAENYGIKVEFVQTVIDTAPHTFIPNTPRFVHGMINLRGTLIPIINLKELLRMPYETGENGMMVVIEEPMKVGFLVDKVEEVLDIDFSALQPPPSSVSTLGGECIAGIHKHHDTIITILDIVKIVNVAKEMVSKYS
ncbi:MAG: chemotaxis protein CheW [bacterium]